MVRHSSNIEALSSLSPTRREFLRSILASSCGLSASGWLPAMAESAGPNPSRQCILLWMTGGPSHLDTFDLKPGHENGGPFQEIETTLAGLKISEHLPKIAALGQQLAVLRGLSTKEGDHGRGTYLMRTGRPP